MELITTGFRTSSIRLIWSGATEFMLRVVSASFNQCVERPNLCLDCCVLPGTVRSLEAAWGAVGLSAVIRQSWYAGVQDSRCVMWYQKRRTKSQ